MMWFLLLQAAPNNIKITGVFGHDVWLFTNGDDVSKIYNLDKNLFYGVGGRAILAYSDGHPMFAIYLKELTVNTIAHESSHTATHIMQALSIQNDEFRAYLTGYLSGQIADIINKDYNTTITVESKPKE